MQAVSTGLYDHSNGDPEMKNLAREEAYREVMMELNSLFDSAYKKEHE